MIQQPPIMENNIWTDAKAGEFSAWMVANKGRSQASARQYVRSAASFFAWVEAGEISPEQVRAWLRHLYFVCGCSENSTRASKLAGLRTACRWLVGEGALQSDPTEGVESPRFHQHAAQKIDTRTMVKLLNAEQGKTVTSIRNKAILLLLYATGMRRAELCSLTLDRLLIGQSTGRVHIRGKGAKQRTVGFRGAPVDALHKWLVARCSVSCDPGEQAVFIGIGGRTPGKALGFDGLRQVLKRAARLAGIKPDNVHLHLLRSTFATDMYDAGHPVKEIALLLGHADESITWRRYIAISERHLKKAMIPATRWRELGLS